MKGVYGMKQVIDGVIMNRFDTFEEARKEYLKDNNFRLAKDYDFSPENANKTKKFLKEKANNTASFTFFGNQKKKLSYSKFEEQCIDKAYEKYGQQYLDIFNSHIPKNNFILGEEWLSIFFYVNKNVFRTFSEEDNIYLLSLPAAIHIADIVSENNKTGELKKMLKDVEPTELDDITDTVHDLMLIQKLVTVIENRNKDHKKYVKGKEHFGEYVSHDNEYKYNLFKNIISLIDENYIQRAIKDVEDLGVEIFRKSLIAVEKPIKEHIELAERLTLF